MQSVAKFWKKGQSTQTLVLHVDDRPGVLDRVASVFRRRAFNIQSLSVGPAEREGVSRMTVVMQGARAEARRAEANLRKLIYVLDVENISSTPSVERHLALIKVRANPAGRREILQVCEVFRARVVDVGNQAMIIESTGTARKTDGLLEVLRPFGILEMARVGAVSMTRGMATRQLEAQDEAASQRLAS